MIYLDSGATSMKKPRAVREAVYKSMECGNPGRGSHRAALEASELIYRCREEAAALFGAEADKVVFNCNATAAINIAVKGIVPDGTEIITSDFEHNSVRRPVLAMCGERGCLRRTFDSVDAESIPRRLMQMINKNTGAVVCLHKSNITGRTMPVKEMGRICRERGVPFIVDASQSAGNTDIDIERDNIDVLCTAGHKGLMGPQGTGLLIFREERPVRTLFEGGSGSDSRSTEMPAALPDRLEAGTLATPSIAGLMEGIRFVRRVGCENIGRHEARLWRHAYELLSHNERITVYDPHLPGANFLFNVDQMTSAEVAAALDRRGICVRPGLHCAPDAHDSLKTNGGAVRASFGFFTTERETEQFVRAVEQIALMRH